MRRLLAPGGDVDRHTRRWREMIVLALVLLGRVGAGYSSGQKPAKSRDLRLYDQPPPYDLPKYPPEPREKANVEIRGFLWTHWHEHQLGKLVATWYSTEGLATTCTYFVEPDQKGNWQIDGECKSERSNPLSAPKRTYYVTREFVAPRVERVVPPPELHPPRIPLPEEDPRPPEKYALVLRDERGRDVQILW